MENDVELTGSAGERKLKRHECRAPRERGLQPASMSICIQVANRRKALKRFHASTPSNSTNHSPYFGSHFSHCLAISSTFSFFTSMSFVLSMALGGFFFSFNLFTRCSTERQP